jgi:hypothetical protein
VAHTGGCLCAHIRFRIDADPVGARYCWCHDCQRIASGSATVNILFPGEHVHYDGELSTFEMIADSGNRVQRGFCPKCGSQMYSTTLEPTGLPIRVRVGTLDNPELLAPQAIIWCASAPSWALLDPDIPHHPKGPDSAPLEKA